MKQWVDYARANDAVILFDAAYEAFIRDDRLPHSIYEVPGARDIAIEFVSFSKSHSMAGWRVGFACGNQQMIHALKRIKSYLDYGTFTPIQVAAITALEGPQDCVREIRDMYQSRRDVLCDGLNNIGWQVERPKATMFVWAPIPEQFRDLGSLEFSKLCLQEAKVAVSPGIGFGDYGDTHVRFGLIENEHRTRQAVRGLRDMFKNINKV